MVKGRINGLHTRHYKNNDYYQTEVDEFMKIISNIKFAKSPSEKGKDISSYHVAYGAYNSSTTFTDWHDNTNIYIIDLVENNYKDVDYRKAKLRGLPIKGILINCYPMERISEGHDASTNIDTYVLSAFINESLIKEDTESLTIENIKEDKNIKYSDYDYTINEISEVLESYNWEEVKAKDLESNPYIILKDNKGTIITLYENNYATYENKEEKIFYKIPKLTIENILGIINKK